MAPKRSGGDYEVSGRAKKKLKMSAARTIAVQANQAPPGQPSSQKASSSTPLPGTIDVERFVEARAFEISAMQDAMKTASAGSTHRVWQTLPRHLRRRAASHDVRRVPLRLRDRARAEMDAVRKKSLGRYFPSRGKDRRITRTDAFLRRQKDKVWLETHVWHAKRMHMENLWGYRLAVRPTEKAFRPSHRASIHGAIIHDASYYTLVEVVGPELLLKSMLDQISDPQKAGPSSARYLTGSRTLDTHIYKLGRYPYDLIGPATMMWQPCPNGMATPNAVQSKSVKGKGKEKAQDSATVQTQPLRVRSVWLRFHPCIHNDIRDTLKEATKKTLVEYKTRNPATDELTVEIVDRRQQFNIFEVIGPKSSQILKGMLRPVMPDKRNDFLTFWDVLGGLQSSGSVPRGMIIGCKVHDPRLNFPPKSPKMKSNPQNSPSKIVFPSAELAQSELWHEDIRSKLAKPHFKKSDLNDRRSKRGIPGTSLNALRDDDRIPIVLIQQSLESQESNDSQPIHGWTLMIPAGWSMAFFESLIYTGSRVAGQRERQTQAFEAGTVHFPRDYPSTLAYGDWARKREEEEKGKWDRKPPAKRVNFECLGTVHPWKTDWHGLFGIKEHQILEQEAPQLDLVSTQRERPSDENGSTGNLQLWLLRGAEVPKILSRLYSVFNHGVALLSDINRLRLKRLPNLTFEDKEAANLLKGALINVKVKMCLRGTPEDLAMIYVLPDEIVLQWEKVLHSSKLPDDETPKEMELANTVPKRSVIIGYVTTGQYSLARGQGYALGTIRLTSLLELEQQSVRLRSNKNQSSSKPSIIIGVRNTDSSLCRAAYLEASSD